MQRKGLSNGAMRPIIFTPGHKDGKENENSERVVIEEVSVGRTTTRRREKKSL